MMRVLVVMVMFVVLVVVFMMLVLMMSVMPMPTRPLHCLVYELAHPRHVAPRGVVATDEFGVRAGSILPFPHALAPMNLRRLALRSELWMPHVDDLSR